MPRHKFADRKITGMQTFYDRFILPVMDLILPRTCIVCGKRLYTFEEHICTRCLADLPLTYGWSLSRNPMAEKFNGLIQRTACHDMQQASRLPAHIPYSHAAALFFFNSEAQYRKIPYSIKYHGDISSGLFFGAMLGKKIACSPALEGIDMIIPVPLYWSRRWERGYNQAEVIARGIAGAIGSTVRTDILYRRHHTETQTRLDTEEKSRNVKDAFGIRKKFPAGTGHILLVDDVFTTGATLHACWQAVRETARDISISVAALAMVSN